jgi:hypothetical protein
MLLPVCLNFFKKISFSFIANDFTSLFEVIFKDFFSFIAKAFTSFFLSFLKDF